jgi:hypothetical protein
LRSSEKERPKLPFPPPNKYPVFSYLGLVRRTKSGQQPQKDKTKHLGEEWPPLKETINYGYIEPEVKTNKEKFPENLKKPTNHGSKRTHAVKRRGHAEKN